MALSMAYLLALNCLWHIAVGDLLGQALSHSSLSHAGLAYQAGVVLGAAAQNLCHTLNLCLPAHHRVQLALHNSVSAFRVAPHHGLLLPAKCRSKALLRGALLC